MEPEQMQFNEPTDILDGIECDEEEENEQQQNTEEVQVVSFHKQGQEKALESVKELIAENEKIQKLSLTISNCQLTTEDAQVIGQALAKNKSIKELILELHYNQCIEDQGGENILKGVLENTSIENIELNLDMCSLGEKTSIALSEVIKKQPHIRFLSLYLSENEFDDEQVNRIFQAIFENNTIKSYKIELWGNNLTDDMRDQLRCQIDTNLQDKNLSQFDYGF